MLSNEIFGIILDAAKAYEKKDERLLKAIVEPVAGDPELSEVVGMLHSNLWKPCFSEDLLWQIKDKLGKNSSDSVFADETWEVIEEAMNTNAIISSVSELGEKILAEVDSLDKNSGYLFVMILLSDFGGTAIDNLVSSGVLVDVIEECGDSKIRKRVKRFDFHTRNNALSDPESLEAPFVVSTAPIGLDLLVLVSYDDSGEVDEIVYRDHEGDIVTENYSAHADGAFYELAAAAANNDPSFISKGALFVGAVVSSVPKGTSLSGRELSIEKPVFLLDLILKKEDYIDKTLLDDSKPYLQVRNKTRTIFKEVKDNLAEIEQPFITVTFNQHYITSNPAELSTYYATARVKRERLLISEAGRTPAPYDKEAQSRFYQITPCHTKNGRTFETGYITDLIMTQTEDSVVGVRVEMKGETYPVTRGFSSETLHDMWEDPDEYIDKPVEVSIGMLTQVASTIVFEKMAPVEVEESEDTPW